MKYVTTSFDEHDHDQIVMLATLNHVTLAGMIRTICQAYLDGLPIRVDREAKPCGECRLQPGEVCDICGRTHEAVGA
jgi:hypothetical protein